MPLPTDHDARMRRALLSLDGLSIGDAFGQRFFTDPAQALAWIGERTAPPAPWRYTDDTEMALGVVEVLERHGVIDQDALAAVFARRYREDPERGYGGAAHEILWAIARGVPWREAAGAVFGGGGSMGNGGAMRVAPLGAYFAGDLEEAARQARASAEVTHMHPEGQAGAIAVAVAAACAARMGGGEAPRAGRDLIEAAMALTPEGDTRRGLAQALALGFEAGPGVAARALGCGERVLASDTVPFALWCAARHLDDYAGAMWTTVAGFGDRDTTCAIAGGVAALSAGAASIPEAWREAREVLGRA